MCLNEKLSFNIKIKSRNCELFVLKKNDFLRLSVNFKEFIESFLHKSLMKYLKFNEEKNQMIKEFDSLINGEEGSDDEEEGDKALESIDEVGGSSSEGESKEEDSDEDEGKKKQKDKNKKEMSQKSIKSKNSKKEDGDKNNESKSESDSQQSSSSSSSSSNKTQEINDNNNNNNDENKDKDEDGDSTYRAE